MFSMKQLLLMLVFFLSIFVEPSYALQPHLSSAWYPQNASALKNTIAHLMEQAGNTYSAHVSPHSIKAAIVPHAAYAYSGTVAASVYRLLQDSKVQRIIVLAPDHQVRFNGITIPESTTFTTALGMIMLDVATMLRKLPRNSLIKRDDSIFYNEHSLEVQLPFIQYLFPHIDLVPIMVGRLTCTQAQELAQLLKPFIDEKTLVIVSSDFTHYGDRFQYTPFNNQPNDQLEKHIAQLDSQAVMHIEKQKCLPFEQFLQKTQATICGANALKLLLSLLEIKAFGVVEPRFVAYDRSSDLGNYVSYVGMLFTKEQLKKLPLEYALTQQEQHGLLQEADAVLHHLDDPFNPLWHPIQSYGIRQAYPAFSTLRIDGQLRGCIGRLSTQDPLYKTIATVTRDAARADTRFSPVTSDEVPNIHVELSILSDSHPIKDYHEITVGKHGVILQNGNAQALFLPSVATEFGWDREQMLAELSKKAGLEERAWQDPETQLRVFTDYEFGTNL